MYAGPLIERELRVRSRWRATSWMRVIIGAAAGLVAVANLDWMGRALGAGVAGRQMFQVLAWLAFAVCAFEGARSAAGLISRERREGTLGFLLLSELSGFEVVLGKFFAVWLVCFYAFLAFLPAMAIALPAGGLTVGEFWRTQAALLTALFLSVAAGLWVSARSQDDSKAILGTVALISALAIFPAWIPLPPIFSLPRHLGAWPNLSPGVLLSLADAGRYGVQPARFWTSLVLIHATGWVLLILAGRHLAATWRFEPAFPDERDNQATEPWWGYRITPSLHRDPAKEDRALLDANPIRWLARRRRTGRALIWLGLLMTPLFQIGFRIIIGRLGGVGGAGALTGTGWAMALLSNFLLALAAARLVADERASGSFELLLATPLEAGQIGRGYWHRLWEMVRLPLFFATAALMALSAPLTSSRLLGAPGMRWYLLYQMVSPLVVVMHLVSICWLALWLGVRCKSAPRAAGLTILWTVVAPYLFQSALSMIFFRFQTVRAGTRPASWVFLFILTEIVIGLGYSLVLLFWARHQLLYRLRETMNEPLWMWKP